MCVDFRLKVSPQPGPDSCKHSSCMCSVAIGDSSSDTCTHLGKYIPFSVSEMWGILSSIEYVHSSTCISVICHCICVYPKIIKCSHNLWCIPRTYRILTGSKLKSMCLSRPPTIPSWSDYTPVSRQTAGVFMLYGVSACAYDNKEMRMRMRERVDFILFPFPLGYSL